MRRTFFILSITFAVVAVLAQYQSVISFFEYFYNRPFKHLSNDQLRVEIAAAEGVLGMLNSRALAVGARPAAPGNAQALRDSLSAAGKADNRLQQLRTELVFRVDRQRYLLIGGMVVAFMVFFHYFRAVYLSSRPGEGERERSRVRLAREQRESNLARERAILAERLGRLDPRLTRVEVGKSDYRHVTELLGRPETTGQECGAFTLTYVFDSMIVPAGETAAVAERVPVSIVLRAGAVSEIRIEPAGPARTISQTA